MLDDQKIIKIQCEMIKYDRIGCYINLIHIILIIIEFENFQIL